MELEIAGKRVVLRDRIGAKEGWPILQHLMSGGLGAFKPEEYERWVQVATLYVQAWEFAGDPADPASYAELDLFSEFVPLVLALGRQLNPRAEEVKN